MFYAQAAIVLVRSSGEIWPVDALSVLGHVSALSSFAITAVSCVVKGSNTADHIALYMALPVFLLALTLCIYVVGVFIRAYWSYRDGHGFFLDWGFAKEKEAPADGYHAFVAHEINLAPVIVAGGRRWRRKCAYMAYSFVSMVYFGITVRAFDAFGCLLYDPGADAWYLNSYPWIRCNTSDPQYGTILGAGVVGTLLYVIGIPALFSTLLWRMRHDLTAPEHEETLGFLYACFKPSYYAWDIVLTLRRVLLAGIIVLFPYTSPHAQALAVLLVLNVSILVQQVCRPHRTRLANALELTSLYVLLVSFLAATVSSGSYILLILVLILNIVAIFTLLIMSLLVFVAAASVRMGRESDVRSRWRIVRVARALHERLLQKDGSENL